MRLELGEKTPLLVLLILPYNGDSNMVHSSFWREFSWLLANTLNEVKADGTDEKTQSG
jgi:hypothetical protein